MDRPEQYGKQNRGRRPPAAGNRTHPTRKMEQHNRIQGMKEHIHKMHPHGKRHTEEP